MKATGIVRRIDDLGRVVIPKEIRRTMRIREGDPLEIYTTREGEVIFKKYSLLGGLEDFAAQFCDALNRTSGFTAAVTDRDAVIAITGAGKRELLGKSLSEALSRVMEERRIYCCQGADQPLPVTDGNDRYTAAVAAPIHGCMRQYSSGDQEPTLHFLCVPSNMNFYHLQRLKVY